MSTQESTQKSKFAVVTLTDKTNAPEGYRLAQILFRHTEEDKKKGKAKKDNLAVAVPALPDLKVGDTITSENLARAINAAIIDWQDGLIRSLVVDGGAVELDANRITLDAVLVYATTESQRKRMTKEAIGAWFDTALAQPLAEALLKKEPQMPDAKLAAIIGNYKDAYSKLAGVKPALNKANAESLKKQLTRAPDDGMRKELDRKLDLIINPPQVDLIDIGLDMD